MNTTCKRLSYDNQRIFNVSKIVLLLLLFLFAQIAEAQIVNKHGRLRVNGNKVVNKNNESISLAGNSLFWSNAGDTADFYNAETVNHLADNWNSDIIRVAMGVKETWDNGTGYIDNPNGQVNKISKVIDAAIAKGIYVIIDFHTHEAEKYTSQAGVFFKQMAKKYGGNDHIIYEIYNEPIGGYGDSARRNLWNNTIKPYAESVISEIRKEDPDNLIVVGTPYFDQGVDVASENQLNDSNVAYALHFYAGARFNGGVNNDHTAGGREKARTAMHNGAALFVTEWGTVDSDGDGAVSRTHTQLWLDFMKENGISHANWAISDKNEGSSVISSGRGVNGLKNDQLTAAGDYAKEIIQNNDEGGSGGGTPTPPNPTPTTCSGTGVGISNVIQAEAFCQQKGIQTENTSDSGGGQNVGYIDNGDYVRYRVNIPSTGTYTVQYRVASIVNTGRIQFKQNGTLSTTAIPNTGNWQAWTTITTEVNLNSGNRTIELYAQSGRWNINWFRLTRKTTNPNPPTDTGGPDGFTFAANEKGTVNVSGTVDIAYGANGEFVFLRNVTQNTGCNNGVFGDPIPGVVKKCYIKSVATNPTPPTPPTTGGNCSFGAPTSNSLASIAKTDFTKVYVLGSGGPNLSNIKKFTINWNNPNNGLYQFSMNTKNGQPSHWIDLKAKVSQNFKSSNPDMSLSGSGINGLDGDYWVTRNGSDFVLVSKGRNFSIYFSNSNSAPSCTGAKAANKNISALTAYPVPASETINFVGLQEDATISIIDLAGRVILKTAVTQDNANIDISSLRTGNYYATILGNKNGQYKTIKISINH